jgi:hypothetical protein
LASLLSSYSLSTLADADHIRQGIASELFFQLGQISIEVLYFQATERLNQAYFFLTSVFSWSWIGG